MKKERSLRTPVAVINAPPDRGLTQAQARQRLSAGWGNAAPLSAAKSEKEIVLHHCFTFFNLIFVVLAVLLWLAGSSVKNMTFLVVVVINTVIGIFQEIRAKRSVDKLTLVAEARLRVLREGQVHTLPTRELVRDDIVEYLSGDQICADGILRTGQLLVNESLITGEDVPIAKKEGDSLLSGSFVVAGTGRVQLTLVGADSFASKLAMEARKNPQAAKSGMMKALDSLIRYLGFALIPVGIALFCQQFFTLALGLQDSAEKTAAALVGMIPEGLYLLTSVAMAASAIKLSGQNVLVQDMNCIETLARVDVLCVDKTGTITEPKMEVSELIPLCESSNAEEILAAFYDGEPENDTGRAMQARFRQETDWTVSAGIPFTSQTKWSAKAFGPRGIYLVGAPECILGSRMAQIQPRVDQLLSLGYRVLLLAQAEAMPEKGQVMADGLTPLALITLTNRIRPEAPATFAYFKEQGVKIKVISGDNPATASEVARRAGIEGAENYVDATTLQTDEAIFAAADRCTVFGRVTPEQKKKLVQALKARKHTVAMTGDGVNDVLAMKEADCGIAMASGSQAASQVAKLVLLNSDFSAMPGIVAEGRRVINNIQRAAALFLVKNIFSFFLSCISIFSSLPYPFIPLHLTLISAATIGIPSFFLAMEPNYQRVSGSFLKGALRRAFPGGLANIFVVVAALVCMVSLDIPMAETSTICTAILAVVGLMVLFWVSWPFGAWRALVWSTMAGGLVLCFTLLRGFLELQLQSSTALRVLWILLPVAVGVFFLLQLLFRLGDRVYTQIKGKRAEKK